jgi:hypothetical protein
VRVETKKIPSRKEVGWDTHSKEDMKSTYSNKYIKMPGEKSGISFKYE